MLEVDTRPAGAGAGAEAQHAGTTGLAFCAGTLRRVALYRLGIGLLDGMSAPAGSSETIQPCQDTRHAMRSSVSTSFALEL